MSAGPEIPGGERVPKPGGGGRHRADRPTVQALPGGAQPGAGEVGDAEHRGEGWRHRPNATGSPWMRRPPGRSLSRKLSMRPPPRAAACSLSRAGNGSGRASAIGRGAIRSMRARSRNPPRGPSVEPGRTPGPRDPSSRRGSSGPTAGWSRSGWPSLSAAAVQEGLTMSAPMNPWVTSEPVEEHGFAFGKVVLAWRCS